MTEHLFPDDTVNSLVDGTVPAADVPASLQGAADVLRAAHRAPCEDELRGMAALVQRFSAEVAVESAPLTIHRSSPMTTARITRRAAAMVAVTLLAAGTAAASAGGVLPSPFDSRTQFVTADEPTTTEALDPTTTEALDPTTTEAALDPTTTEADEEEALLVAVPLVDDDLDDDEQHDSHLYGKCTAWTHGAAKNVENPAFSELQTEADAAVLSIDDYCAAVIAEKHADKDDDGNDDEADGESDDDDSDDDESDDESDDDESDDDESDDDSDDDDDDDESDDDNGGRSNSERGKGHGKDK